MTLYLSHPGSMRTMKKTVNQGSGRFCSRFVPDLRELRRSQDHVSPGERARVIAVRVPAVGSVQQSVLRIAHAVRPRAVHGELVPMVEVDPVDRAQSHRVCLRVVDCRPKSD